MLAIDRFTGPAGYTVLVVLAAWYSGRWPALALAIAIPVVRFALLLAPTGAPVNLTLLALTLFRGVVIGFIGIWFARLAEMERHLDRRVNVLEGLLPICSFCKKIRNETGEWERLEGFISRRSEAQFSHGLCPTCGDIHYPEMLDKRV
jgi:hypothetical protein